MAYGIKISKAGYDVKTTPSLNLILDTTYALPKIKFQGSFTVTINNGDSYGENVITHNLGFPAPTLAYLDRRFSGGYRRIVYCGFERHVAEGIPGVLADEIDARLWLGSNTSTVGASRDGTSGSVTLNGYYYIFTDDLGFV